MICICVFEYVYVYIDISIVLKNNDVVDLIVLLVIGLIFKLVF